MDPLVSHQFILATKALVARGTFKWFKARVYNTVAIKFTLPREGFGANTTHMTSDTRVLVHVLPEGGFIDEFFGAFGAREDFLVTRCPIEIPIGNHIIRCGCLG